MQRDYDDLIWGALLAILGVGVAVHSAASYDFGTIRRMGPGFFPTVLGVALAILGAGIALPAWWRKGTSRPIFWREALAVTLALLIFSAVMRPAGVVLATLVSVLVASAVAPKAGIVWRLGLAVAVAGLTWLIFIKGLDMSIPVWPWS